ncbi:MAG: tRNA pseudouridine synthase A [bacterium]
MSNNSARYCLEITYRGKNYYGFQRQADVPTVQQELEEALAVLFKKNITVYGSGRTDRGVHALGQVVHFELPGVIQIPANRWGELLNKYLPADIGVLKVNGVDEKFHARHSARKRVYSYRFCRNGGINPFAADAWFLDREGWSPDDICRVIDLLSGGVPTSVFSGSGGSSYNSETWPLELECKRLREGEIWLLVAAESFRYRMVRCLARAFGNIIAGTWEPGHLDKILKNENRTVKPAPAAGCFLTKVFYEEKRSWLQESWHKILNFFGRYNNQLDTI